MSRVSSQMARSSARVIFFCFGVDAVGAALRVGAEGDSGDGSKDGLGGAAALPPGGVSALPQGALSPPVDSTLCFVLRSHSSGQRMRTLYRLGRLWLGISGRPPDCTATASSPNSISLSMARRTFRSSTFAYLARVEWAGHAPPSPSWLAIPRRISFAVPDAFE